MTALRTTPPLSADGSPADEPAPEPMRWQQRKAAATRKLILDAATDCLVEGGYARLTTVDVLGRAKVSRGAMHHHFPSRADLVSALIEHVLHKRLDRFLADYLAALQDSDPALAIEVATEVHWQSVKTPEFTAYLELVMAARTDEELAVLLIPATREFEATWMREVERALPHWQGASDAMLLANDVAAAVHLGLLINRPFIEQAERREAVRTALVDLVKDIFEKAKTGKTA
ncbi:MAG: TetR/AcrR family transcriptional regulator [Erythrobacter sp.]